MRAEQNQKTQEIIKIIKVYENFPKPGVNFLDVFSLLSQPALFNDLVDIFAKHLSTVQFDKIFMLQSRGFLFGPPLSTKLNKPCYPIRKKGKLPGEVSSLKYDLEYGSDQIEIQKQKLNLFRSSISQGQKIILVDDVLATGGTLNAAIQLVEQQGGIVEGVILVNIIKALNGLQKLKLGKEKVFYVYDC